MESSYQQQRQPSSLNGFAGNCASYHNPHQREESIEQDLSELILLTFGPTRHGKSSCVNQLLGYEATQVGDKKGDSTTVTVTPYAGQLLGKDVLVFDTPGQFDSRLLVTNGEIREMIKVEIVENSRKSHLSAILLFESCTNDSIMLRITQDQVSKLLSPSFGSSTIVMLTKHKQANAAQVQNLISQCEMQGLRYMLWESVNVSPQEMQKQKQDLLTLISQIRPYALADVDKVRQMIVARALELQKTTPKETQRIEFEEEFMEYVLEDKVQTFTYVTNEIEQVNQIQKASCKEDIDARMEAAKMLQPLAKEMFEKIDPELATHGGIIGTVAGLLLGSGPSKEVIAPQVKQVTKTQEYVIQVPKGEKKKKLMNKDVDVELPIEVFVARARKEVMAHMRKQIGKK